MSLTFCAPGNHAVTDAIEFEGVYYCPEHPPRPDVHRAGRCAAGHDAYAVWTVPNDGKDYCGDHLLQIIRIATWGRT